VAGSELVLVDGMAHDIPNALVDRVVDTILTNVAKA
jgi:hypothetical protein